MKAWAVFILSMSISFSLLAQQEVQVISCSEEANQLTLNDFVSNIRNKAGFEAGELSFAKKDSEQYKNVTLLKNFNEEKNLVTYKSTIVGDVTNLSNGKVVFSIDECEVRFLADSCQALSVLCSGI
jgi:hypothetical protein